MGTPSQPPFLPPGAVGHGPRLYHRRKETLAEISGGRRRERGALLEGPAKPAPPLRIQGSGMLASWSPVCESRRPPRISSNVSFCPWIKPAMAYGPLRLGRRLERGALPPGQERRKPGPIIYGAGRLLTKGAGRNQHFPQTSVRQYRRPRRTRPRRAPSALKSPAYHPRCR